VSAAPARRTGLVLPSLFAFAALVAFLALGTWQVQRKAWKEGLIDSLEQRLSAPAVELPPRERWGRLDPTQDEFRRVKFSAAFVPGAAALVFTGGSTLRSDVTGPGYWVFAPARLTSGATVVVNRGFVPEGQQDAALRVAAGAAAPIELIGVLRSPEARSFFAPRDDPAHNLWFVRDPIAIAAAKGWGEVAPFFVELEAPRPPGGLPRPGALTVNLRNEHLQYAIT
jgi:surfeit locus 1 family protein